MATEREEKRARMLDKVRKLLAMARDGRGNANEEETAMRHASRLMAEYGISEADADMAAINAGEMIFGETTARADGRETGKPLRSCPAWAGTLAVGCARFCDAVVRRKMTAAGEVLVFQGERDDVLLARWLFGVLVNALQHEQRMSGWTGRGDANAFRLAAAGRLHGRLVQMAKERRQAFEEAQAISGSRALVVVDRKAAVIAERFGAVKYTNRRQSYSGASGAAMAGTAAGGRINIPQGRPIATQDTRKLTA